MYLQGGCWLPLTAEAHLYLQPLLVAADLALRGLGPALGGQPPQQQAVQLVQEAVQLRHLHRGQLLQVSGYNV